MSPVAKDNPQRVGNIIAIAAILVSLSTWAMGAVHVLTADKQTANERTTAVETKQVDQEKRLDRIENKVDGVEDKVDQVLSELRSQRR